MLHKFDTREPQLDPLKPGYPFNAHLVAGSTPIHKNGDLDFWINRPSGLKGFIINLTVAGTGLVFPRTEDERRVHPGDMMLLPTGVKHDYGRAPEVDQWYHRWIYFRPRATWSEWLKWANLIAGVGFLSIDSDVSLQRIESLFEDVEKVSHSETMLSEELSFNLLEQILIRCCELDTNRPQFPIDKRIHQVCQYIHEHLGSELSITELSKIACMSNSRFSHLFKQQLGVPVRQWIEDQRVSLARQLLITTNLAVNQVSRHLGYQDALYFSRVFKKKLGVSPREYREGHL
ncbi:arabinose operon transcriptional regulator AraC [Gynuella sunshinyii]|uniref:AraC-type DNA-binding domain-containing protein n=1 Tax=Gynuella sunshinyii YC6258 TaxID=1445510 RepID=A0A0C5VQ58_9GAMM|nr:arabinose operon transcriptional regulator AraC [Gynuella sunshinyii]AJQ92414.1 araC-type DNA-binding domain-containing protein [Gynuella sunshinyii YC6258]